MNKRTVLITLVLSFCISSGVCAALSINYIHVGDVQTYYDPEWYSLRSIGLIFIVLALGGLAFFVFMPEPESSRQKHQETR